jgi:hypothetical protein
MFSKNAHKLKLLGEVKFEDAVRVYGSSTFQNINLDIKSEKSVVGHGAENLPC